MPKKFSDLDYKQVGLRVSGMFTIIITLLCLSVPFLVAGGFIVVNLAFGVTDALIYWVLIFISVLFLGLFIYDNKWNAVELGGLSATILVVVVMVLEGWLGVAYGFFFGNYNIFIAGIIFVILFGLVFFVQSIWQYIPIVTLAILVYVFLLGTLDLMIGALVFVVVLIFCYLAGNIQAWIDHFKAGA
jgi:hypothetical protein